MKKFGALLCSAVVVVPSAAFAQSTGTSTFENTIIVTGTRNNGVGGVKVPDTTKAKNSLNQDFISRQQPGQSIDDMINYLPGVSFQSNGPYGDAGGTLTIHGFDSSRISQTFDGVPMNDSGNYALYSQEQLDPELIQQVNVSVGSTDLDSPTASATGGTVNYVLRDPYQEFHVRAQASVGDWDFRRFFGSVDTGNINRWGTRAFIAASNQHDVNPYDSSSEINKTQLNAKVYQPLGQAGDFVSANAFYVKNRGNHFNDVTLATFPTSTTTTDLKPDACTTTTPVPGVRDTANSCGQTFAGYYGYGQNPANILRLHVNSRVSLSDKLIVTVEPNYERTEANGSGPVVATEGTYGLRTTTGGVTTTTPIVGYIGGKPYFGGVDLNGDGDTLDTVLLDAPSNTLTHRYGVIANVIYKMSDTQEFRVNYTLDHAKLRQTGELGYIGIDGRPTSFFPAHHPINDVNGQPMEKRNRLSYSILNQVSGQYRGKFMDNKLVLDLGLRAPFFTRKLHNYCVSESGGNGYVDCFNDAADQQAFLDAKANSASGPYQPPQARNLDYHKVLPSAGFTYALTPAAKLFFNFSEGLQVPSTDALYDSFAFPVGTTGAAPKAEMSRNWEGGLRYTTSKIQAQLSGWYTAFSNRIEESLIEDPENPGQFKSVYTNLGDVHKYGVDGSIAYAPSRMLTLYAFGSYLHSKILDNVQSGSTLYLTAGKQESGNPTYTFGGRAQGNFGPIEVGVQAKWTGPRFVNDLNTPYYASNGDIAFGAKTPAYAVVDLDARVSLGDLGLNKHTFLQFNVHNLFDKFYVSGFNGQINNAASKAPFVYVGAPTTVSATLNVEF